MLQRKSDWLVSGCAAMIAFATLGISRSSGVLFVEIISEFQVSRETASWPFAVQSSVMTFSGLLPGLLAPFLSFRQVLFLGACFTSAGIGLGFFAHSLQFLIFSYGIIFGIGFGLLLPTAVVTVNQRFQKHRASANGVMWAGDSLALFLMPPLFDLLIERYGLRGTFLIVGGLFLNLFLVIYFMTPHQTSPHTEIIGARTSDSGKSFSTLCDSTIVLGRETKVPLVRNQVFHDINDKDCNRPPIKIPLQQNEEIFPLLRNTISNHCVHHKEVDPLGHMHGQLFNKSECFTNQEYSSSSGTEVKEIFGSNQKGKPVFFPSEEVTPKTETIFFTNENEQNPSELNPGYKLVLVLKNTWSVASNPLFTLVTTTHLFFSFIIVLYCTIVFDYSLDIGMERSKAVYITTVFAFAELLGRTGTGWITDNRLLQRKTVILVCEAGSGLILFLHTFLESGHVFFAATAILGFFSGTCFTLSNVMYIELLGLHQLVIAVGLKNSVVGAFSFLRPTIIGLSRDNLGSYVPMLYLLSGLSVFFGVLWFLEPFLLKRRTTTLQKQAASKVEER